MLRQVEEKVCRYTIGHLLSQILFFAQGLDRILQVNDVAGHDSDERIDIVFSKNSIEPLIYDENSSDND